MLQELTDRDNGFQVVENDLAERKYQQEKQTDFNDCKIERDGA